MRVLHTSDWHVGKRIGRYDRMSEYEQVISEVVSIADTEDADLVLHSGDLFDRPMPPVDALDVALDGLVRLAAGGRRPVVVIAGNHDSPGLFEALAPFLRPLGIHLVGEVKPPDAGGVIELDTRAGRAVVSCFPFLREGRVVDFMERTDEWYKSYADRLRRISETYAAYAAGLAAGDGVTFLVAHFLVGGVKVHGHGAPRGERELHMGEAYTATAEAIPPGPQYVAMGHIHAPQAVPGARVPAEYAGSLLELDFGEAGETKRVVVVDVEPGLPATRRGVELTGGRRLVRAAGTWADLRARPDLADAYLDLKVHTEGPEPGLADQAREAFPFVVKVSADYPRTTVERPSGRADRSLDELYAEYYETAEGVAPPADLIAAFHDLQQEVADATA